MSQPKIIIEKFDKRLHARETFDCGEPVLNEYLKQRANQEQKKRLSVVYVALLPEKAKMNVTPKSIVGYYTLTSSSLKQNAATNHLVRGVPPTYDIPSIKIGRLALDKTVQGYGLGSVLLADACERIIELSALAGVKGVEVVAKNLHVAEFYKSFGFVPMKRADNSLFLPLDTLLKTTKSKTVRQQAADVI